MPHFLIAAYAVPGHINPAIQLAKRLIRTGAHVTFLTTVYAHRRMIRSSPTDGLTYATFSDGYDDAPSDDRDHGWAQFKQRGQEALADLLRTLVDERRPATCVIYTLLLTWAAGVARSLHTPHVLLWVQPATVFAICYHCFHGCEDVIAKSIEKDPSCCVELPGLPLLTSKELPSFILPSETNTKMLLAFREQFELLDGEERPRVLVNTFDDAELDVFKAVGGVDQISVGPLIPTAFFDGHDRSHATDDGEVYKNISRNYIEWLDSKPESSVVYISFGSIMVLEEKQMVEILIGLLESGHPFLWVIRSCDKGGENDDKGGFWEKVRAVEERKEGMVVAWCSQLEVLSHSSVGCFVSHCGWNSTLESLTAGVPMVCLPHWVDQTTNAKLVEDVWKVGVRAVENGEEVFEGSEVKRCLDLVMEGEGGEEMRRSASRWRDLARAAIGEGGPSDKNIRAFVEEMRGEVEESVQNDSAEG